MADRPVWKGTLKIALVQIPIKVYPATSEADKISLNQLHGQDSLGQPCHARIKQQTHCPACKREVEHAELVKGYEFELGKYVVLLKEELEAIAPPSTRVIDLTQFAPAADLGPLVIDRSYYLQPAGPLAAEAFAVMRDAMRGTAVVGIGKVAVYGREYLGAVGPLHGPLDLMLLSTLHHDAEIRMRPAAATERGPIRTSDILLARRMVKALTLPFPGANFIDQYQAELRQLIAAKIAGAEYVIPPIPEPVPIGNLRDALEQSLLAVSQGTRIRPKAPVTTKAMRQGRKLRESA